MPVKITTTRGINSGSLPGFARSVKIAFVGETLGEVSAVDNLGSALTDSTTTSSFSTDSVKEILKVSLNKNDNINIYKQDLDYQFVESSEEIEWLNNSLGVPELEGTALSTGGTGLGTTTHNYVIVATGVDGTTAVSNTVEVSGTGATASHKLDWNKIDFATGYLIYDSTANTLITSIASPNTTTYTRESIASTPATIPSTNTAVRRPAYDSTYFVDYVKVEYDYTVNNFTSLNQVQSAHGVGSELTNMARIAFQQFRVPEIYTVGVDGTNNADYMAAIDKLSTVDDINYVTVLRDSTVLADYVVTHCEQNSRDEQQKERFGVVHVPGNITEVGDDDTEGTVRYRVASFLGNKRAIVCVPNGNNTYMNTYQETDGTYTDNKLVQNYFVAGAVGCACVTADDVATSIIGKELPGFGFGPDGAPWVDAVEKNKIELSGGTYISSTNGRFVVYNDNTNDTSITENAERCIVSAEDEMKRRLRAAHRQYLGRKITNGLINAIYSTTSQVIKNMVSETLLESFNEGSLEVIQDSVVKTKATVSYLWSPAYPLKELQFIYTLNL